MVNGSIIEQEEEESPVTAHTKLRYNATATHGTHAATTNTAFQIKMQETGEGSSVSNDSGTDGEDPRKKKTVLLTENSQGKKKEAESIYNRFNDITNTDIDQQQIKE
jgi:hypothetical protein